MLTAREIALKKTSCEEWLDKTATRNRVATSSNLGGGQTRGSTTTTTYDCRIRPASRTVTAVREGEIGGEQIASVVDVEIELPVGADVLAKDTLTVDSVIYEVIGTNAGSSEAALLIALCKRIS